MPIFGGGNAPGVANGAGTENGPGGDIGANTPTGMQDFQVDPITGYGFDPSSRTTYQKINGQWVPVHDLTVSAQVSKNIETANYYANLAKTNANAFQGAVGQQQSLADAYRQTISDPNAPSVAREQLNQALGATDATQLSQAAGASGENALVARTTAANNIAGANAAEGGQAALLRAQETSAAQAGLGSVTGAMANEENTAYGANTGLGSSYSTLAGNMELGGNTNETAQNTANKQLGASLAQSGASGASGASAPSGGSSGAGAAALAA